MNRRLTCLGLAIALLAGPGKAATVVLDTGHTKARPGSMSAGGQPEYGFNVRLSDEVAKSLTNQGVTVRRVAADGRDVALAERTLGTETAELFVSVHHDSIQQEWIEAGLRGEFAGFAVFTSQKNKRAEASEACARKVGQALVAAGERPSRYHAMQVAGESRPIFDETNGAHHFDDLVVLKTAKSPAILIEAGVIANPQEEVRLGSAVTVSTLARAITQGIIACLSKQASNR